MTRDYEISIADMLLAVKRRARLILAATAAFMSVGLLYAILAPPLYSATVTAVVADAEDSALSSVMGRFAPAAALAGIRVAGGSSTRQTYLAILRSQQLADGFVTEYNLLPYLFPDRWDANAKVWTKQSDGFFTQLSRASSGASNHQREENTAPSAWQAYQAFKKIRSIQEDATAGTITVSFRFRDPKLAAEWANGYIALANEEIRTRTVKESSQALAYLNNQAESTRVVGLRDTIYRLVESHLEKIALANTRQEFAFTVIDRAVPPEERSHPKRKLIVVLSMFAGISFGVLVTLIIETYFQKPRAPVSGRSHLPAGRLDD